LKGLLSPDRYFEVKCPPGLFKKKHNKKLEKLKECIVQTVQTLPHWGEEIPLSWASFEEAMKERKTERVLKTSDLRKIKVIKDMTDLDIDDMLEFFHQTGQILYFADDGLKDLIIIDVQWFVDGFKHIISDENHLARQKQDCDENMERGIITVLSLQAIWKKTEDKSYVKHQHEILPFMEKLGLMVKIENREQLYIPSMNRIAISPDHFDTINCGQKTSILIFHFKMYLPHFFFFRLVVRCFRIWNALKEEMFCKNAAFYKDADQNGHFIAIAVNKTSIQVQVFTQGANKKIDSRRVRNIRGEVENIVGDLTKTFHKQVQYELGYSCKEIKITDENHDCFVQESKLLPVDREQSHEECPEHILASKKHKIKPYELVQFWNDI
jgi:hypothetical protein